MQEIQGIIKKIYEAHKWPDNKKAKNDGIKFVKFDLIFEAQEIGLVTPKEITKETKETINLKKASGYNLLTEALLKKLPTKGIVKLINLIKAAIHLKQVTDIWKIAEIIMIVIPGKPEDELTSYKTYFTSTYYQKITPKTSIKRN